MPLIVKSLSSGLGRLEPAEATPTPAGTVMFPAVIVRSYDSLLPWLTILPPGYVLLEPFCTENAPVPTSMFVSPAKLRTTPNVPSPSNSIPPPAVYVPLNSTSPELAPALYD